MKAERVRKWGFSSVLPQDILLIVRANFVSWYRPSDKEVSTIDDILDALINHKCRYKAMPCLKAQRGQILILDDTIGVRCCTCRVFLNFLLS